MSESSRSSFSVRDFIARIRQRFPWPPIKPPVVQPPIVVPDSDQIGVDRRRAQVGVIREAFREKFGEDVVAVASAKDPERAEDDADVNFLYHPRRMLVREGEDFEILTRFYSDPERERDFEGELTRVTEPIRGELVLVEVPMRRDGRDAVLASLREIDRAHPERTERRKPVAQPDHVLYVTAEGRLCPDTEPEVPREKGPVPPLTSNASAGKDVSVSVVDTGWWKAAAAHSVTKNWVSDVQADPEDEEHLNGTAIHEYAGHGTFVAGVIKCLAPAARVEVEGALPTAGAVFESDICEQLDQALHDDNLPNLISISAGTHTRKNLGLLGFEILMAKKGADDGVRTIVIAAAGNDETDDEFYPAAYDWVVGVGSVDPDGKRSKFSNYGKWVNVYARGRDLVNAFCVGTYTCHYPENIHNNVPEVREFDGLARWSGTSFATPVVTGAIAAHMSETANLTDPWKAYQELLQNAHTGPGGETIIGPL